MEMVEKKFDENFGPYEDTREVGRATWKSLQLGLENYEEERTNQASGSLRQVNWQ